jgi:anti-sigma B factor antagonist
MHVDIRQKGDVLVVDLEGKLVRGVGDLVLRETIDQLLADDWTNLLLNLSGVTSIDSSGVGELVAAHRLCDRFGGQLKLLRLSHKVKETLGLSLLLPVFEIFDDEAEGVASFS